MIFSSRLRPMVSEVVFQICHFSQPTLQQRIDEARSVRFERDLAGFFGYSLSEPARKQFAFNKRSVTKRLKKLQKR